MRAAFISCIIVLCTAFSAIAEELPTTGTFEGFYHRDRWEVGHFGFFIVHPDLHEKLSPYEGKPIRLQVTKGSQPKNPGSAVMLTVGKIASLGPSPLQITISTIPGRIRPNKPFQLIMRMVNNGNRPLTVPISNIMLMLRCQSKLQPGIDPAESSWLIKEYTNQQMSIAILRQVQMGQALLKTSTGGYGNLAHGSSISIPPYDTFPIVVAFDEGLDAGEYEIEACTTGNKDKKLLRQTWIWQNLDIPARTASATDNMRPLRVLRKEVSITKDGYTFDMAVAPPAGKKRRRAAFDMPEPASWAGRIHAYAADGTRIPLKAGRIFENKQSGEYNLPAQGRYMLVNLPEEGLQIRGRFHKASRFGEHRIDRVLVDILTARAAETVVLAADFKDVHWSPPPPFGRTIQGVKLRVRPAQPSFAARVPLRFYLQAVKISGKAIMWQPRDKSTPNIRIEVDGKKVNLPAEMMSRSGGWAGDWVTYRPDEWTLTLPQDIQLKAGKHSLRCSIRSRSGTYKNANGKYIPLLKETLISNTVEFEIR